MKTDFASEEFLTMLTNLSDLVNILVKSEQYQELVNDEHYSCVDFTLTDALVAFDEATTAFEKMKANEQ